MDHGSGAAALFASLRESKMKSQSSFLAKAQVRAIGAALFVFAAGFAASVSAAPVELISNGNFETGNLSGWSVNKIDALGVGDNNFYVIANGGTVPVRANSHPTQSLATGGDYVAVSDQNTAGGEELRQSFTKTSAMTSLILNFDWFNNTHYRYDGDAIDGSEQAGRVDVLSGGAPAFAVGSEVIENLLLNAGTFTDSGRTIPWLHASFDLSALAEGTYELRFGNGQCCGAQEFGVDNVSLLATSVPEPATLSLALFALAGLGWSRKQRRV